MTLKPCPFAHDYRGGLAVDDEDLELRRNGSPHVHCGRCGTSGPWVDADNFESQEAAEAKAVELWNARAVEPAPTKGN